MTASTFLLFMGFFATMDGSYSAARAPGAEIRTIGPSGSRSEGCYRTDTSFREED